MTSPDRAAGSDAEAKAAHTESPPAGVTPDGVRHYLLYSLSLPERALRSTVGLAGGMVRESADLLVPQAFRQSKSYTILVQQALDFLTDDVAGVQRKVALDAPETTKVENFVAKKAVGNFVEMASLATLHVSPMLLLAVVSDVAYGSQSYLKELAVELKQEGVIDPESTIDHAGDLLDAIRESTSSSATLFDTPPLSVEGLREVIDQTAQSVAKIDPTKVLPAGEIERLWREMQAIASKEEVSLLEVSGAMTLHALDRVAHVGRGTLSAVRVAGTLLDRHVIDHYQQALGDLQQHGYYATLADVSQPYIAAVWANFSSERTTLTEDLLSGKLVGQAADTALRWLGLRQPAAPEETAAGATTEATAAEETSTEQPAATESDPPQSDVPHNQA